MIYVYHASIINILPTFIDLDIVKIIKTWMLPISMTVGVASYLFYRSIPQLHVAGPALEIVVSTLQPLLIFSMLFLTFCRIEPRELKPHRWHWWLLLVQGGVFSLLGLAVVLLKSAPWWNPDMTVLIESAMLCFICPTATAAAVVTRKLGGDVPGITTYTVLINFLVAALVPLIIPVVHPDQNLDFLTAFSVIIAKVFPILITPCLLAWLVRYLFPKVHKWLMKWPDLPFYLWGFALALAIAVTTRSILKSEMLISVILMMSVVSLVCCLFMFLFGRFVGGRYRPKRDRSAEVPMEVVSRGKELRKVTAGQALGQKNIVFAIWMSYTFMTPETAIVGGLYSIWHNIYNSWQLYRAGRR